MKRLPVRSKNFRSRKPKHSHKDKTLYIIISITLTAILGIVTINPALPTIANALQIQPDQIGLVIAAFVLPITFGVPIFGVLADRIGRKKVIIPCLILFAIAGVLCSTAQDFISLLEWRFLQGIGAASLELLALTLIGDLYSGETVIPAMAFLASTIGISTTVFPLIGGALAELNWRFVFLLPLVAIPIALLVLTTLKLPPQPEPTEKFSLKDYVKDTWSSVSSFQVLGLLFAVVCVFILEFGPCYIYIPMFAATTLHAKADIIGVLLASMQVWLAIFASQLGPLSRKMSEATMIKIAFFLFAIAFFITPFMTNIWMLFIPCSLMGIAEAFSLPPTRALLARISPNETRAGFMAANAMSQSMGQALGPILTGIAFAVWGMQGVFYACAVFALLGIGVLQVFLDSTKSTVKESY
jgi:MFS family permease